MRLPAIGQQHGPGGTLLCLENKKLLAGIRAGLPVKRESILIWGVLRIPIPQQEQLAFQFQSPRENYATGEPNQIGLKDNAEQLPEFELEGGVLLNFIFPKKI